MSMPMLIRTRLRLERIIAVLSMFFSVSAYAADITGVVSFEGERPKRKVIDMAQAPDCVKVHTGEDGKVKPVGSEDLIVSASKKIKNVFVYLKEVPGTFEPAAAPAVLSQEGCVFSPHVQGVVVGGNLEIRNLDPTLHNVHAFAEKNPAFNMGQPKGAGAVVKTFRKPEMGLTIKCDVHPWMKAYVHVLSHPFFATTDPEGAFSIKGLPPGKYTLVAWHEVLGQQEKSITVSDAGAQQVDFSFAPKAKEVWEK